MSRKFRQRADGVYIQVPEWFVEKKGVVTPHHCEDHVLGRLFCEILTNGSIPVLR